MKNVSRPQYYRIRRILEMIRNGPVGGKYPNAVDFCREFGVSRPTVMRDIDFLRNEENAPIEYVAEGFGYKLTKKTWSLPPVRLSKKEIFAFSIARKLMEGFRGTPLEVDMRSVLTKVGESMEGKVTIDPAALSEHFTVIGEDYVRQDAATWTEVTKAVERQQQLRVVYEKFNGEVKSFVLEPYHLVSHHGNWYMLAGEAKRATTSNVEHRTSNVQQKRIGHERAQKTQRETKREIRTFAISRLRDMKATGRRFEVPEDFDPKARMGEAFGITSGTKTFKVRLLFAPSVAAYIKERIWHPSQKMRVRRNGGVELSFKTGAWKEIVRWVLSWQPDVTVLEPVELRERVRLKMKQGLKKG